MKTDKGLKKLAETLGDAIKQLSELSRPVEGWYNGERNELHLAYYDGVGFRYGFNRDGDWFCGAIGRRVLDHTLNRIDDDEVESRLIDEALRRGFVGTVGIEKFGNNGKPRILQPHGAPLMYFPESNKLTYFGWDIYKNGKWANIIENIERSKIEIKIGSIDVEISVSEGVSYKALAISVARVIKDEFGGHNIEPFMQELNKQFKSFIE